MLVVLFFVTQKIIIFYIFFELSLIPIFLIIIGWGYQRERLKARLIFIFYTIIASLPLLTMLIFLFYKYNITRFTILNYTYLQNSNFSYFFLFIISIAFLVKVPIFLVHLWLPKAHTEAPVIGSIILAAILLKLGTYGIYLLIILCVRFKRWNWIFRISLIGGALIRLLCLQLTDLKIIIAYSSVAHISIVLVALTISQVWGSLGAIFLILAHGFTSSGLFISVNIIYERSHSRRIVLNKGLIYQRRRFIIFWFLLVICNIAAPPTLNFFSEVFTIIRIVNSAYLNMIPIFLIIIFTSGYSLIVFRSIRHGKQFFNEFSRQFYLREFLRLFLHLVWSLLLILTILMYI